MKILVTGANGFVGKSLVSRFLQENYEVISLKKRREGRNENTETVYHTDITNYDELKALERFEDIFAVIHCAGLAHQFKETSKEDFWRVNVEGTKNIARLAVKLKSRQFILISSVSVYGDSSGNRADKKPKPFDEKSECKPDSFYARSKLESEKTALEICEKNGISLTVLRLATVIGEGDPGNVSRLIKIIDKKKFVWLGNGTNRKSLIYKQDVAGACLRILENKTTNETEIFNVTAEPIRMKDIVSEIGTQLNRKIPKISIPKGILRLIFWTNEKSLRLKPVLKSSATVEKWLSEDVFSGESISRKYGFRPRTPIKEAIKKQIEAYKMKEDKESNQK